MLQKIVLYYITMTLFFSCLDSFTNFWELSDALTHKHTTFYPRTLWDSLIDIWTIQRANVTPQNARDTSES